MNKKQLHNGIYATLIKEYAAYKRSQGYKWNKLECLLARFDKLASDHGETKIGVSKDLAEEWSKPFPQESERSRHGRISILRGFSSFLQLKGYTSYIPSMPRKQQVFVPHIYTSAEISAIFRECDKLTLRIHFTDSCRCVMPCLIRVLYSTGIRISEALKLTHADVDLTKGILVLRECKNGQDRIVPMSLSLQGICKDWVVYKQKQNLATTGDAPFFTAGDGHSPRYPTILHNFRAILLRAGIAHGGRGNGPRLHDLRHTFCVNSLAKLAEAGLDVYYIMPILMAYMGHKSMEMTNYYVRLTQEKFPKILLKMDEAYKSLFPKIGTILEDECL